MLADGDLLCTFYDKVLDGSIVSLDTNGWYPLLIAAPRPHIVKSDQKQSSQNELIQHTSLKNCKQLCMALFRILPHNSPFGELYAKMSLNLLVYKMSQLNFLSNQSFLFPFPLSVLLIPCILSCSCLLLAEVIVVL